MIAGINHDVDPIDLRPAFWAHAELFGYAN
jgi:hypothetical protein